MAISYLQTSLDKLTDARRADVIEICINPDGRCWGEFQGDYFMRELETHFNPTELRDLGNQIASSANTTMSKDKPIVSVSITYRDRPIRAQVITPPAVLSGMSISLRFFSSLSLEGLDLHYLYGKECQLEDLRHKKNRALREVVASGAIADALRFCVTQKLNMIIAGGTSTGKTIAARKILSYIGDEERIVTIEEAAELLPRQPNAVTLIADRDARVQSADMLLTASLRMRPDRIIIGEVRGAEALDMLQAMNTGHEGSMTTIHANDTRDALARLEMMVAMSGFDLPLPVIRQYIANGIGIVLHGARLKGGQRCITRVSEIIALNERGDYQVEDIFGFEQTGLDDQGNAIGHFYSTGYRPACLKRMEASGIRLRDQIFEQKTFKA